MALSPLKTPLLRPFLNQVRFSSTDSKAAAAGGSQIATWNDYFKLRKKRRAYEVAMYLPSTIAPAAGTFAYFLQMQVDPLTKVLGMDPLMAAVASTFAAGFGGFLMGPIIGNSFFKLMNGKVVKDMDIRDKEFFEHIKKNRADARLNSIRNPVPDYYGEKIQSVQDYRAWLRKQREHYRKGVFGGDVNGLED